jgi:hypothetical protein
MDAGAREGQREAWICLNPVSPSTATQPSVVQISRNSVVCDLLSNIAHSPDWTSRIVHPQMRPRAFSWCAQVGPPSIFGALRQVATETSILATANVTSSASLFSQHHVRSPAPYERRTLRSIHGSVKFRGRLYNPHPAQCIVHSPRNSRG